MPEEVPQPNAQLPEPLADSAGSPEARTVPAPSEAVELSPEEQALEENLESEVAFQWQASEYVHHHKGPGWYLALVAGVTVLSALAILLHYWLEFGAFLAMTVAIVVYARKPPRTLQYELTPKGIVIEGREHEYGEFRSFGVVPDTNWHTIDLEPAKRLRPRLAILFDSNDFEAIVGHLELHLPRIDHEPDIIDQLSQYLRF